MKAYLGGEDIGSEVAGSNALNYALQINWLFKLIPMVDDARKQLQERLARVGARAVARLHEMRPDLLGKSLEDTVTILKEEERRKKLLLHDEVPPSFDE